MSTKFKKGDVVQLASGGPEMTVVKVEEDDLFVHCLWFISGDKLSQSVFPVQVLMPAHRDSSIPMQSSSELQAEKFSQIN